MQQHKTCENYQELTVVDVVDNVEDSLRDKVARIDMLNKLIGDEISDIAKWTELSINNSKAQTKESVDDVAIKDVQQEIKLHEQKVSQKLSTDLSNPSTSPFGSSKSLGKNSRHCTPLRTQSRARCRTSLGNISRSSKK